jgi:hypothetical protein
VALAAGGCGDSGEPGSGGLHPRFLVDVPAAGQAIVRVKSDLEGDRVCDQAQLGDFDELAGVTQLIIKPPDADQGRNMDGSKCALPPD